MRYLRKQILNRRAPFDDRLAVDITNSIVMNTTNNMLMPKGTTSERPVSPVEGMIRYNTTTHNVEIFQGATEGSATWRSLRFKESTGITQQSLGIGDYVETTFGPLSPQPPTTVESGETWGGQNLLVIVENVIQIHDTNYTITYAPANGKSGTGAWITFSSAVPGDKPVIVLHGFDQ